MKSIDGSIIVGLLVALLGTLVVALSLSYLYPVIAGHATSQYFQLTLHSGDAWRLIFAVFIVSSLVTTLVFILVSIVIFIPLFILFPRLMKANVFVYFLLGVGASLLVLGAIWLIQTFHPMLVSGDYLYTAVGVVIDGPLATLIFRFASRHMAANRVVYEENERGRV